MRKYKTDLKTTFPNPGNSQSDVKTASTPVGNSISMAFT
jgi:hypothetical protein